MNSMTGYGSASATNENFNIKIDMKSVNNRYCDIFIRLPKSLFSFEDAIKKQIKSKISRGKVDVFINLEYLNSKDMNIDVDFELAKRYLNALNQLKEELEFNDTIKLRDIYYMDGVLRNKSKDEDPNQYEETLFSALDGALNSFIAMRNLEGEGIKKVFEDRLVYIRSISENIRELAPLVLEQNTKKLKETISNNLQSQNLDSARLSTEIAIMCDKLAVDEEITRLFLHIDHFEKIIQKKGPIGRKLDFLIQELNREVNTIGSKSNDIKILNNVVELKSELEKLREQIQNIE